MTLTALNGTIVGLLRSRGHQRLWLVLALIWIALSGWHFWKPLPRHQAVDVSAQVADQCQAEESANVYAAGEGAYQRCLKNRGPVPTATDFESIATKLKIETLCNSSRVDASVAAQAQEDPRQTDCMLTKMGPAQNAVQPEADRVVDQARDDQLLEWTAITLLPPIALPIAIVLVLYGVWTAGSVAKWIREGYRRKP
ncbi:MAG: hypothetical protein WDM86_10430 [Rhizomicrobium sp.]